MEIHVRDSFYLTSVRATDKASFLACLNDPSISEAIPALPFPYTEAMADWWIKHRLEFAKDAGAEISFVLRNPDGKLMGSFGVDDFKVGSSHRAEIGYWLAQPYRGQNWASDTLRVFVDYAFANLQLSRLTAHTLASNQASARVLEKCGFKLEGCLRQHTKTKSGLIGTFAYGLLKSD
ncbi:N-acetyltransferase [filamentous cyanobacterium CCT1]|nr:N-acetyltransferase [filamentous cyanobacterium CCT1]PSN79525.1 N-acetyltransferase [filamentous cyanobacterium CCP4]